MCFHPEAFPLLAKIETENVVVVAPFPKKLKKLAMLGTSGGMKDFSLLPHTVTHISIENSMKIQNLPPNLTHFSFCRCDYIFDMPKSVTFLQSPRILLPQLRNVPSGLKHLSAVCNESINILMEWMPTGLTFLRFMDNFNQPVENLRIFANLKTLIFGDKFGEGHRALELFGETENRSVAYLPPSLTQLQFGKCFDTHKLSLLPEKMRLQKLSLGSTCSIQQISTTSATKFVTHLAIVNSQSRLDTIPPYLTHLLLLRNYNLNINVLKTPLFQSLKWKYLRYSVYDTHFVEFLNSRTLYVDHVENLDIFGEWEKMSRKIKNGNYAVARELDQ